MQFTRRFSLRVTASLLLPFFAAAVLEAASWPLFRGTAERTGIAEEQADPSLTPRWHFAVPGQIVSSPVVYKGTVYFGARDGSIWALDAHTGEVAWQYSTSGWVDATPCVSSDTVFAPSRDQNLYAFDRLTGTVKWQAFTGSMDCSSPLYYDGKVYLLSGYPEKSLYCFNAADGTLRSAWPVSQYGFSSPALLNGHLYFGTNDGQFHCLDLATGQTDWDKPTKGGIFYSTLAASSDAVYAVSGGDTRRLYSLDPATGQENWQSAELDTRTSAVSSVSLGVNRIYVASTYNNEVRLHCFDLNGSEQWAAAVGTPHSSGILSSPCVVSDVIYIGSGDGHLYCINAANGQYIAPASGALSASATGYFLSYDASISTAAPGIVASPCVANGWVYAAAYDGNVWAFEASRVTAISSPDNGDRVVGAGEITGTVSGAVAPSYALEYGAGAHPGSWSAIQTGNGTVASGVLGHWDTSGLADGSYSLRLTVDGTRTAVNRVIVDNPPRAPVNLTVGDTPFDGGGSLSLQWTRSADDGGGNNDVTGYRIYKGTAPGAVSLLAQTAGGTTGYVDAACPAHTTYYYVLTAIDRSSESSFSNTTSGTSILDGIEITPESGGTVILTADGLTTELVVPPGCFAEKAWVGIRIPDNPPAAGIPANARDLNSVREFGITPAGTRFLKPVTLKLPYQPAAGLRRENLRIYWWDEGKSEWRIVNTSDPVAENGRVWATVPHFAMYRVMEYTPGRERLLQGDRVYTFPNPAKGDRCSFKFYLGDKADVTIDVYNVAGELIAHLEKAACPAGLVSELDWNIAGIASGVYVYRLEARSGSAEKSVKKKLAIIH